MNSFYRVDPALATERRRHLGQAFYFEGAAVCRVLNSWCYIHLVVDSTTSSIWQFHGGAVLRMYSIVIEAQHEYCFIRRLEKPS